MPPAIASCARSRHSSCATTRDADYVFRWGGDEFLLLLSCREEEAHAARPRSADGLPRESATAKGLPARRRPQLSAVRRSRRVADTVQDALKVADARMYSEQARGARAADADGGLSPPRRSRTVPSQPITDTAGTSRAAAATAPPRRPTMRRSPPGRRRRGSATVRPSSRTAARPPRARTSAPYSLWSIAAISTPSRTGRSAARSVTIMNTPWHSSFAYLLDVGREPDRVEPDAREGARVQRVGELHAVDPGRADLLERRVGAASDRDVRALDRADARIQRRLHQVAHVRRRVDPGQPGLVEPARRDASSSSAPR